MNTQHRELAILRPRPLSTRTSHIRSEGKILTAIARTWLLGDAERCNLCPDRCHASISRDNRTALCLMVAQRFVSLEDAKSFSPTHFVPSEGENP